ncbi:DUF6526 family protein [Flavobacterium chungangense]|uniref:Uncharacterized protein n=1 Tax=Flavobacterium chungangense TaxID=554283 RepID=A0A6V6Z8D4_9FLAO|nr:DUF6526 family protein [Flavobacterium chungangense]CAD0008030.1 hypothetical protein FLACHUCJ7_03594 [Flavobacterium chungangense]
MKTQSYKNHVRFYPPHHFVYYPILIVFMLFAIYFAFTTTEKLLWGFITVIFIFLFCLAFMLRQHYALILQNRIVKLELRYRYFVLTGTRFETIEYKFTEDQLFAFRFASDTEFLSLIDRALAENLSGDAIKQAIVNWKGDYNRV